MNKVAILGPILNKPLQKYIRTLSDKDCLDYPGHSFSVLNNLVEALYNKDKFKIIIISLDPHIKEPLIRKSEYCDLYSLPRRQNKLTRDLYKKEKAYIREAIEECNPDLIHVHWTYEYALAVRNVNIPKIMTVHDHTYDILKFSGWHYFPSFILTLFLFQKFKYITTVSPYICNFINHVKLTKGKIWIIFNPIENSYDPTSKKKKSSIHITCSSGWNNVKNPKLALRAFSLYLKSNTKAVLNLAGVGLGLNEDGKKWAEENNLSQNVNFLGSLNHEKYLELLSNTDIYLHTSKTEAMPLSILEAMLYEIPVIAGKKSGAIPWLLENGKLGFLVDIKDKNSIAQQLIYLTNNISLQCTKIAAAKNKALSLTNPEKVYAHYLEVYENVWSNENQFH
jgi:L-malate glycosyltransferase